jgi:hypothetical protein
VLADTVHDRVIDVALERDARKLPSHPRIERIVQKQIHKHRRDHAPNAMGNFDFDVSLSYRRLERPRRVTRAE